MVWLVYVIILVIGPKFKKGKLFMAGE